MYEFYGLDAKDREVIEELSFSTFADKKPKIFDLSPSSEFDKEQPPNEHKEKGEVHQRKP